MRRWRIPCVACALPVLAAVLVGGVATSIAAAQTAPTTASSPTDIEARRIVREYSVANQRNNDTLDVEGQDAVEGGPLQLIDDATFREVRGRGDRSLHERAKTEQIRVYVPDLTTYPLQFLATERVSSGGDDFRQVLVFGKASEADPWRVSMAAQASASPVLPKPLVDREGDAVVLDADHASELVAAPESLASALADRWAREAGEERAPDKVFREGTFTTGAVDRLVNELARRGIDALADFGFDAAPYPVVAYRTADGGALCFFVVGVHETVHPKPGDEALTQPRSRERFTGLIVPGKYQEVGYERLALVTAKVPSRTGGARGAHRVRVVGFYDGVTAASATAEGATGASIAQSRSSRASSEPAPSTLAPSARTRAVSPRSEVITVAAAGSASAAMSSTTRSSPASRPARRA